MKGRPNKPSDVWDRIDYRGEDECWPFTGTPSKHGYGQFMYGGKKRRPHVVVYTLVAGGCPPAGMVVMHSCNNKGCCNPKHLFLGTYSQNGRHAHLSGAAFGFCRNEFVGVSEKRNGKWHAYAFESGRRQILLYYGSDKEAAIAARLRWEAANPLPFGVET